jgi:Xaa-Pro aminopeptidase
VPLAPARLAKGEEVWEKPRSMVASMSSSPASVFRRRRERLASQHPGAALVFSGGPRARNYPANTYAFRADSHFLWLVGTAMADAALLLHGGRSVLLVPPEADDDALWHGTLPSREDLRAATGVDEVRSTDELAQAIADAGGADRVATLPSADPLTRARQARMLARTWDPTAAPRVGDLAAIDLALADAMIDLRLQHDDAAVAAMQRALEGTAAAHLAGMKVTRAGLHEHDVRAAMERELVARGMDCAYGSIVTVHGEILHNTTYHHRLEAGDLLLADLGGEHEGWASDITRTWPVSGEFSPTQRALYDIVLAAQLDAIAKVVPGTRYRDVHLAACITLARGLVDVGILKGDAESLVERGAHALFFPHGIGHLIGMDVHDMEDLGDRAGYAQGRSRSAQFGLGYLRLDRDLQPGMAVTIEPGLYLVPAILQSEPLCGPFVADGTLDREAVKRFSDVRGIRIEDDVLCTPTGPNVLSHAIPKAPEAVEAAVGG